MFLHELVHLADLSRWSERYKHCYLNLRYCYGHATACHLPHNKHCTNCWSTCGPDYLLLAAFPSLNTILILLMGRRQQPGVLKELLQSGVRCCSDANIAHHACMTPVTYIGKKMQGLGALIRTRRGTSTWCTQLVLFYMILRDVCHNNIISFLGHKHICSSH